MLRRKDNRFFPTPNLDRMGWFGNLLNGSTPCTAERQWKRIESRPLPPCGLLNHAGERIGVDVGSD